ncbi:MAG: pilus assembly protein TadG-related protein [Candidatus Dormibacteraceae bacterium]
MMLLIGTRRRQSGQILPIAAAAFLVMCALSGLAIDASRDYLIKRDAQNAADFAVLAAAKQMAVGTSLSSPIAANSSAVIAAHDFAALNGFSTTYSNACDVSTGSGFTATWFDVTGLPCNATTGFNNKVTIQTPPVSLPGNPAPPACAGSGQFSCVQVLISTRVAELFTSVLGIPFAYVTVGASAQAVLPGSSVNAPPPNALVLYQPQSGCDASRQQCFDETKPVTRALLACSGGSNNCPTFWTTPGTAPKVYGFDGSLLTPAGDYTTLQSNGDMVVQDRTTFCDPYGGRVCVANTAVGLNGFAIPSGAKLYCSTIGGGGVSTTPCTTTGQASLNEIDGTQAAWQNPAYWYPTVNTSGLKSCGSLVLNGNPVYGACANPAEPYVIEPGFYSYIVINHGTYEFDSGLYDITGVAPVNDQTSSGYIADGIDHSKEVAADFDLCTGGLPNSCPTLTAGVWIGHGGGGYSAYAGPLPGSCTGGVAGSGGGGGDTTTVSGSGVVFRLESSSAGFVVTHEVSGMQFSGAGVNQLASVGGSPLLLDMENSSFIHLDAALPGKHTGPNTVAGILYQTSNAKGGGIEINLGMSGSGGGARPALQGQVLAYSFTTFGTSGTMDFQSGYGTGAVPGIATSGRNETSIISSVSLTAAASPPNSSVLTVNYSDEWMMDGYDVYVKVNNGSPIFFSQGIWTTAPGPGAPLPPPNNNPSDAYPAYPTTSGSYTIAAGTDWTYTIPGGNGATIEATGDWAWGHQSDIPGAASGAYTAQLIYTFPNPNGNYVSITLFALDGDHCGDYAYSTYTFKNTGLPGAGSQTVGSVSLVQ